LFATQSAQLSGAELVLADLVRDRFAGSQILLFENGPLKALLEAVGHSVIVGRGLESLAEIRRDGEPPVRLLPVRALLRAISQVTGLARTHRLVYAGSQKAFIAAAPAARVARRPLIWHLHDIMTREHFGPRQIRLAIRLANRFAARVIVPSQAVADAFKAAGGREDKVRLVANGVSIPAGIRDLARDRLRAELGLPAGFLVSVVGRLAPWKGQHVVLQALPSLPGVHCIIVGDALFGEASYADELRRLTSVFGLGDRVRFLGHRRDVAQLMRASDVVVHSSVQPEPFGRVIVEAMLCATPVVAARAGGVLEILDEGHGACLYPPGDAAALANLLRSFQEDKYCRAKLVERGVERAERLFSVSRMQRDVNSVVTELLAGSR
jgi:glycosyltransferase involved in cell wall biosynthesis